MGSPSSLQGARVPAKGALPAELHDLLEWNALALSEEGWKDDVRRLIAAVAKRTGRVPAADVDNLLIRVGEAEARMRAQEQERHRQSDQIRALTDTVAALTSQLAERPASHRADLAAALAALGRGDTSAAEAAFERVVEERGASTHEAAEAARHIANLALLGDIGKAKRYYRRACELEPGHAETWRLLGQVCLTAGNTREAGNALTRALEEAEKSSDSWDRMAALTILGDLALRTEHLGDAFNRYNAAREIVIEEAGRDAANTQWQRELSVSHNKIGDVLVSQGDLAAALTAYRKGPCHPRDAGRARCSQCAVADVAISCAKLSTHAGMSAEERRDYLHRGLQIQQDLNASGRLPPNQGWISWFEERLKELDGH